MAELGKETAKALELKKRGTLLSLGPGEWEFGKIVFTGTGPESEGGAKSLLVADGDAELLKTAEKAGVPMTSTCDIRDLDQLETLGKYDGVVGKGVLEHLLSATDKSLEDLLFALYKTVRLKGRCVLVSRLRPTLPLPKSVIEAWSERVPSLEDLLKEAAECGFTPTSKTVQYSVSLDSTVWKAHLLNGGGLKPIPFLDKASKEEIEKFMATQPAKIVFKDEINIVSLTKIITRTPVCDE